jgi:prepilin-type N-terminal cleavage/methylation domain-containing protein/prepilin-type processing-associated H-X9-DG protein
MKFAAETSHRGMRGARGGYSLVEVLVTIVALGILMALLLPSFRGLRSASQQISCSIQLKRIDDGLNQFADDNDGDYTIAGGLVPWEQVDPETNMPSWMQQVVPYLKSKQVLAGCGAYPLQSPYHYFLGARAAYIDAGEQFAAVERDKVRFPDSFVLTGDNNFNRFTDLGPLIDADKDDYVFMTQLFSRDDEHWAPHHDGLLNTAFADGHVAVFDEFDPERMTYRYDTMSAY